MKKIILPTDFSENAYNAISYALNLFKDEECAFYLLNTFNRSVYYEEQPSLVVRQIFDDPNQTNSLKRLQQLQDRLLKKFNNPKHIFVPHSSFNSLLYEIKETIEKEGVDLIVMGTQGATGAMGVLFGTNTLHIIKKSNCPVIAVPSGFKYKKPKNILFPTDYEVAYQKEQLGELLHIAEQYLSHIAVLHISSGHDLAKDQLANKLRLEEIIEGIDHHLSHIVTDSEINSAINDFQLKNKINLLVMMQNKRTFMERLFSKSEIKQIGLQIKVPFMVIPCQ